VQTNFAYVTVKHAAMSFKLSMYMVCRKAPFLFPI